MGIIWSIFSNFQLEGDENDNESPRVLEQYAAQVLGNKSHTEMYQKSFPFKFLMHFGDFILQISQASMAQKGHFHIQQETVWVHRHGFQDTEITHKPLCQDLSHILSSQRDMNFAHRSEICIMDDLQQMNLLIYGLIIWLMPTPFTFTKP